MCRSNHLQFTRIYHRQMGTLKHSLNDASQYSSAVTNLEYRKHNLQKLDQTYFFLVLKCFSLNWLLQLKVHKNNRLINKNTLHNTDILILHLVSVIYLHQAVNYLYAKLSQQCPVNGEYVVWQKIIQKRIQVIYILNCAPIRRCKLFFCILFCQKIATGAVLLVK